MKAIVIEEAVKLGVPISLALAVAHVESGFSPRAESSKGARGVMQIMPDTAALEYAIDPDVLWQPRINVRLGLHFLNRLLKRYNGRVELALSFYNGGVGGWRWQAGKGHSRDQGICREGSPDAASLPPRVVLERDMR